MSKMTPEIRELIAAAWRVRRFWQATCDANPERSRSWEDNKVFYDLADALDETESPA